MSGLDLVIDVPLDKTFSFDQGDQELDSAGYRLKFEQGRSYRVSFVIFPGGADHKPDFNQAPRWWPSHRYYNEVIRQFVEYTEEHRKFLTGANKPRQYAATVVINWPTDLKGKLDQGRIETDASVKYLLIDKTKYSDIKNLQDEFPFGSHDLGISCTDSQFQKITSRTIKGNMFVDLITRAQTDPQGKAAQIIKSLLPKIKQVAEKLNGSELAHRYSAAEVDMKIRGAIGGGGKAASGATLASQVSNEEIDDILKDL